MNLKKHFQDEEVHTHLAGEQQFKEADFYGLEVEVAAHGLESAERDLTEALEIEGSLEEICSFLEQSLESAGGIDSNCANGLKVALSSTATRMGVSSETVATFEHFEDENHSSKQATEITLESVGETIKKVWKAILTALKRALKAVGDFFKKVFQGIGKLRKQLVDLRDEVKKSDEKFSEKKKITISNPSHLWFDGSVESTNILSGLKANLTIGKVILGPFLNQIPKFYTLLAGNFFDKKIVGAKKKEDFVRALGGSPDQVRGAGFTVSSVVSGGANTKRVFENPSKLFSKQPFIGGNKIALKYAGDRGKKGERVINDWQLIVNPAAKDVGPSIEVDRPSQNNLILILDSAIDLVDMIAKEKDVKKSLVDQRNDILDQFDNIVEQYQKGKVLSFLTQMEFRSYMGTVQIDPNKPVTYFIRASFQSLTSVKRYAEKSLAA